MKILYAIQGTGNGHIARASEILPILKRRGEVDVLMSGSEFNLRIPFFVNYKFQGLNYAFGESGGIDFFRSFLRFNPIKLIQEIKKFPITKYDLIISDFEPVSSWAAKGAGKPCIGIGNHPGILHPLAPQPRRGSLIGKMIVENYAPSTFSLGFNFKKLGENIYTPIIRKEIRELPLLNNGHYTIYLPSYLDKTIVKLISCFKKEKWEIFSRFITNKVEHDNITILPIENDLFIQSMASSKGVICNAGFGTTSEALFLKKKLLAIPMKWQYEQHCNAAMLETLGVTIISEFSSKFRKEITHWMNSDNSITVDYPDLTENIIDRIIQFNETSIQ